MPDNELVPEHEPVAADDIDDTAEDPMPTFEWELDFETTDEPEASPLFPEIEVLEESEEVSESQELEEASVAVTGIPEMEVSELWEIEIDDDTPELEEPADEVSDSLEYERLRAAEIALLAPEDELSTETPELIRILEDTLPQPAQVEAEIVTEPVELEVDEPAPVADAATDSETVVEEVEELVEASDVATRIETFRQRLATFPTDEGAALALADTCLRYGLLEEALQHYRKVQKANPSCPETSARIIKAALWMEDVQTVKTELWKAARLSFDLGDLPLEACQQGVSSDPDRTCPGLKDTVPERPYHSNL